MRQVKGLVGKAGQGAFSQSDQPDGHVDVDHGDGGMDVFFDGFQIDFNMFAFGNAVYNCG